MSVTPSLYLATPAHNDQVGLRYHQSVLRFVQASAGLEIPVECAVRGGDSLIHRARAELAHQFLCSDASHLFFVDADIDFEPEEALSMLAAMEEGEFDIVGGSYTRRRFYWDRIAAAARAGAKEPERAGSYLTLYLKPEDRDQPIKLEHGCIEVSFVATGFLLVRRRVFEEMAYAHPELLYLDNEIPRFSFFQPILEDRRLFSEDYSFCKRWRDMGGRCHVFRDVDLGHTGMYRFVGGLRDHVADNAPPEWEEHCDVEKDPDSPLAKEHVARYEWAAKHLTSAGYVVDAACGTGYGSQLLEDRLHVPCAGFDRNRELVQHAKEHGRSAECRDLGNEFFHGYGFDALVSLETLEHLEKPWEWLAGLSSSITQLVCSAPVVPTKHLNKWHLHDFTQDEVTSKLAELGWSIKDTWLQDGHTLEVYATR